MRNSRNIIKSSTTYDVSVRPWGGMTVERLKDLGFKDANSNSYDNVAFTYTTDEEPSKAYKKLRKIIEDENELGAIVMFEEQIIKSGRKSVKSSVPFRNKGFNLTGHEVQEIESRLDDGETIELNGWTFEMDCQFDCLVATSPEGKVYDNCRSFSGFLDWIEFVGSSRKPIKSDLNVEDEAAYWDGLEDAACGLAPADEDDPSYMKGYRNGKKRSGRKSYADKIYDDELASSRRINSSQKGYENVVEGTPYDDYHIDTTGMGILDVEHIINEIEGRGNQAVLTVQTSDGRVSHTQFNAKDWKEYKDAVNGVDDFSRNSGTKGAAITDVWVTEVKGGSYVRNSRKAIKSALQTEVVENFPEYMVYYAVYGEPGGDVTDEDIQTFEEWRKRNGYGWCYGFADDNAEGSFDSRPAFGLACDTIPVVFEKISNSRKAIKSEVVWENENYLISTTGFDDKYYVDDKLRPWKAFQFFYNLDDAIAYAQSNPNEGDDIFPDERDVIDIYNSRKPVKSARFLVEDENGEVIAEADTYEEAQTMNGARIIDTENQQEEGFGLFQSKKNETTKQTMTRILSSIVSGEMTEDEAAEEIAQNNNCNIGYAKTILSYYMEDKDRYLTSGMLELGESLNVEFDPDGNLDSWSVDFATDPEKPAPTLGGELVRAARYIISAFRDSGEKIGTGYAREVLNPAARFIIDNTDYNGNNVIQDFLNGEVYDDERYEDWINDFETDFADYLRDHSEFFEKLNKEDFTQNTEESDEYGSIDYFSVNNEHFDYWFEYENGQYVCDYVDNGSDPEFQEGDIVTADEYPFDEIDFNEEYGSFTDDDGFTYWWEDGDGESVRISDIEINGGEFEEGDILTPEELQNLADKGYKFHDRNGNEIKITEIL